MNIKREKRTTVLPVIRVSPSEKKAIKEAFLSSSFPSQSAFIRYKVLTTAEKKDSSVALKEELRKADLLDSLQKIEATILQITKLRNLKKEKEADRKELLLYASVIQTSRLIQSQFSLNDPK